MSLTVDSVSFAGNIVPYSHFTFKNVQSGLCGRITPYWRMSAGMICLVASILAICCSIVWHAQVLCVPFGLSTAGSVYTLYLGYQFHHVKNLKQQNENYARMNQQHNAEVSRLGDEITRLQTTSEKSTQALQNLHESLIIIHNAASSNHTLFGTQLEGFSKDIDQLTEQKESITQSTGILATTVGVLKNIFNEDNVKQRMELIETMNAQIVATREQMQQLDTRIQELESIRQDLRAEITKLGGEIQKLELVNTKAEK